MEKIDVLLSRFGSAKISPGMNERLIANCTRRLQERRRSRDRDDMALIALCALTHIAAGLFTLHLRQRSLRSTNIKAMHGLEI